MREVTEGKALVKAAETYPGVSKVAVDDANGVAYVFTGRGLRAAVVSGDEFAALVKVLPSAEEPAEGEKPAAAGKGKK